MTGVLSKIQTHRIFAIGLLALVLQAIAIGWVSRPWMTGDSHVYFGLSEGLTSGHYGLPSRDFQPDVLRPPGYPIILYLTSGFFGLSPVSLIAFQLVGYVASIYAVARLAPRFGVSSAIVFILASAYPFAVAYSARYGVEGWMIPLYTGFALLVASNAPGRVKSAVAGIIGGFLILLRSDMLLLPLLGASLIAMLAMGRREKLRDGLIHAILLLAASVATVLPYSVWNWRQHHHLAPSPAAAAFGSSLYSASWQEHITIDDFNQAYEGKWTQRAMEKGLAKEIIDMNRSIGAPDNTAPFNPAAYETAEQQIAANEAALSVALQRIRSEPGSYFRHVFFNLWELWNTTEYPGSIPPIGRLALQLVSGLVASLAYLGSGAAMFNWRNQPALTALAILALYPLLVHLPLHTEARYTAAARPLFLFFAAFTASRLLSLVRSGPEGITK